MEKISVAVHDERICKCCGNHFVTSRSNQFFCSRKCNKKFGRLKNEGVLEGAKIMRRGNRFTNDEGYSSRIRAKSSRFEYLCQCEDKNYLYLICSDCGNIVKKTKESIKPSRSNVLDCQYCRETLNRIKEKAKEESRQQYIKSLDEARKAREEKKAAKRIMRKCARCGKEYISSQRIKYCSNKCSKRARYANSEHTRRIRCKSKSETITLNLLRDRDNDMCWICKKKCLPSDYVIRDGAFIVGDKYPSIDHVVALSNGGTHTWDNVRLAHFRCNTVKRNNMYFEGKNGQISMFV